MSLNVNSDPLDSEMEDHTKNGVSQRCGWLDQTEHYYLLIMTNVCKFCLNRNNNYLPSFTCRTFPLPPSQIRYSIRKKQIQNIVLNLRHCTQDSNTLFTPFVMKPRQKLTERCWLHRCAEIDSNLPWKHRTILCATKRKEVSQTLIGKYYNTKEEF